MSEYDWRAILDPANPWEQAYPIVERAIVKTLDESDSAFTTSELAKRLWPKPAPEDKKLVARLYRAMMAIATHGKSNRAIKQAPQPGKGFSKGKMVSPITWV